MWKECAAGRAGKADRPTVIVMGRAPRLNFVDGLYHVTSRGVRRLPIYEDGIDYRWFRRLFDGLARELGWICHAYCLMPNHYHLVLETPFPNLSVGLQRLNWRHSVRFNWRHGHTGHLFERRFHSELIETDAHLLEAVRYVVLNPVRAGLCHHPAEWPFSSYWSTLDAASDPSSAYSRILGQFGTDPEIVRARYEAFVADGVRRDVAGCLAPGHGRFSRSRTSPRTASRAGGRARRPAGPRR